MKSIKIYRAVYTSAKAFAGKNEKDAKTKAIKAAKEGLHFAPDDIKLVALEEIDRDNACIDRYEVNGARLVHAKAEPGIFALK